MNKRWKLGSAVAIYICVLMLAGCGGPKWTCDQVSRQIAASDSVAVKPDGGKLYYEWWAERHEQVKERMQQGDVELLLIGDSITHGWDNQSDLWERFFGQWNTVNAGFGGDRTEHVLWRLDNGELDGSQPKVAMILIGTNNSKRDDYTAEEIAQGIAAIVCRIRTKLPETKILLLGIFPRGNKEMEEAKTDAVYNSQWAKNDQANLLASRLTDNKHVFYLNINQTFLNDEGVLTKEIMFDVLHPTPKGYEIWGEAIMPTLEKLMADY